MGSAHDRACASVRTISPVRSPRGRLGVSFLARSNAISRGQLRRLRAHPGSGIRPGGDVRGEPRGGPGGGPARTGRLVVSADRARPAERVDAEFPVFRAVPDRSCLDVARADSTVEHGFSRPGPAAHRPDSLLLGRRTHGFPHRFRRHVPVRRRPLPGDPCQSVRLAARLRDCRHRDRLPGPLPLPHPRLPGRHPGSVRRLSVAALVVAAARCADAADGMAAARQHRPGQRDRRRPGGALPLASAEVSPRILFPGPLARRRDEDPRSDGWPQFAVLSDRAAGGPGGAVVREIGRADRAGGGAAELDAARYSIAARSRERRGWPPYLLARAGDRSRGSSDLLARQHAEMGWAETVVGRRGACGGRARAGCAPAVVDRPAGGRETAAGGAGARVPDPDPGRPAGDPHRGPAPLARRGERGDPRPALARAGPGRPVHGASARERIGRGSITVCAPWRPSRS